MVECCYSTTASSAITVLTSTTSSQCTRTHECISVCTHTYTHTLSLDFVHSNPRWKVHTHPTKGYWPWIIYLQALKLGQVGKPPEGWMSHGRYSRNLSQKTWYRCKHHLLHCVRCMHDVDSLQDQHKGLLTPPGLHYTVRDRVLPLPITSQTCDVLIMIHLFLYI